ncbi:zinc knuckle CX2CX4HX4C containing protein [Tanacetum coccineum]
MFASVVQNKVAKKVVKVKELRNSEKIDGASVAIPIEAVTEAKYGLKRIQLHEEFFLFQFDSKEGMESVMEHEPWLIRRMPLMLNIWTPNIDLKKDDIKCAPLWVKLFIMCLLWRILRWG